ncbi:hypothetical protein NDU88_004454 [Pleurodeles waltl]|uniref:Uncharacterized protein n=1 Tax=Pleurodeles waltl TaxID=8319 RepID=A0AAV7UH64_PLEWA|nr:hypothetical protein NDU88_004454 [Pleurodeles waltl]
MIECLKGTSKCGTSGCRDGVKNLEEDAGVWEAREQKGDADSDREENLDWRGTMGKTASRDEEEASESCSGQKAKQTDDNNRRPMEDALAHPVSGGTGFKQKKQKRDC